MQNPPISDIINPWIGQNPIDRGKNMTFTHFIKTLAPDSCGVHPSFGEIANLVHEAEQFGNPSFKAEVFKTTRERAVMYAPYETQAEVGTYANIIGIIEYAICKHRKKDHKEDMHDERIGQLSAGIDQDIFAGETLEMATRGWWGN